MEFPKKSHVKAPVVRLYRSKKSCVALAAAQLGVTAYSYVWTVNIRTVIFKGMKVADAVKMPLDSQVRRNQRYYREIGSGLVEDNTTQNRYAKGSKCQLVGICAGFFDGEHGKHANQAKPREQLDVHCSLPDWVEELSHQKQRVARYVGMVRLKFFRDLAAAGGRHLSSTSRRRTSRTF